MKTLLLTILSLLVGVPTLGTSTAAPAAVAQDQAVASTAPAVVFIMRHAEKPVGEDKSGDLTPTGFKRAALIPTLFVMQPGASTPARFPKPDAIFATDAAKHSNRPIETITPLAQTLHMKINHDFADVETGPLAKKILGGQYAGKVVVVCWHHGEIPHLAQALGVTGAPKKWDPDVFDRIWEVRWVDGKAQLQILPEHLLPGDSAQ
jgi:hypothetical protein